jgi:hypothetical protein
VFQKNPSENKRNYQGTELSAEYFSEQAGIQKKIPDSDSYSKNIGRNGFLGSTSEGIQRAESEIKRFGIEVDTYFFDLKDRESFKKQAKLLLKKKADAVLLAPSFVEEASDLQMPAGN